MDNSQPRRTSILARGSVVRVAVFACIILVMLMTASLWHKWTVVKEPTTAIAVIGDGSLNGAKITVEGIDEDTQRQTPVQVTLSADHKYQQAIYRYPGRYRVTVMIPHSDHDETIAQLDMTIDRFHGAQIDLPTTLTIIGHPGDRITLTNEAGASQTFEPNSANKYRVTGYLAPGKYKMSRTSGGAPVPPDEEITILAHTPKEITLPPVP